jgi:hypothetical protein
MDKIPKKQRIGYATVHYVAKARKSHTTSVGDTILVGQPYWWWKWAFGKKQVSLTKPTAAQLDKYPYTVAKAWEELKSRAEEMTSSDEVDASELEELISELEEFRDQREEAISNMEEYFQESEQLESMKEMLEEVEGTISELENIETDED